MPFFGAGDRGRTGTVSLPLDFEFQKTFFTDYYFGLLFVSIILDT